MFQQDTPASTPTHGVAVVRVRRPSGALRTFDAERIDLDHGLATAVGSWRHDPARRRQVYVWSSTQLVEVRYEVSA